MTSLDVVSVTEEELEAHLEAATREVQSFAFRAPLTTESEGAEVELRGRRLRMRPLQSAEPLPEVESEFSLTDRIRTIAPRDELYTDVEHHVLLLIRRAVQVYLKIHEYYESASGLARLKEDNTRGRLRKSSEPELAEKVEAGSASSLFAFSAFLVGTLSRGAGPDDGLPDLRRPDRLPLSSKTQTLRAGLHYLYTAIDAHARDDASLRRAVRAAALELAQKIQGDQASLPHLEFFTRYHYRIEADDLVIIGFELPEPGATSDIQVQPKRPDEVVGNHIAKLEASRIAQRIVCYDVERQSNPFVDLGGFVFSFIGDGQPGTGKTTLIQMMVSLMRDYAEVAGVPLRYHNFSVDEISDYQGRSGHNAKQFCRTVLDPRGIGFGTIDDVDQVCGNRNDRNASAGQLEVTAVFMQEFGGANTVVRGNATFGLFSNYPEKVDDALRQRTQTRFRVDGPETREDFADLFHILLSRSWELPLGRGYEPRTTQQVRQVIDQKYAEHDVPDSTALRAIFDEAGGRKGLASWREFGDYLHALQQHDPRFTGRALKNIADAVNARMMDFDLPDEWLTDRDAFFARPYEQRVAMLSELRGEITPEMVIQEIHRYADSEARYGEAADTRELEERTRQILLEGRAREAAARES